VALFAMYYNFVRIYKTLRTRPAMAAGVTSRLWEIGDIVDVLEAREAKDDPWGAHSQRCFSSLHGSFELMPRSKMALR
jgi:hypothetical protein